MSRRGRGPRLRKHQELREQLNRLLESTGTDLDSEEKLVIDYFLKAEGHVTPRELAAAVGRRHPEVDAGCTRGVLRMLERLGIARRVKTSDKEYYEHLHVGEHHDHLICVRCGRIYEFLDEYIESRQLERARLAGFQPLFHRLQMFGICAACMDKREPVVSLAEMSVGERGEIEGLSGGRGMRMRLGELGLTPGTAIEVLASRGPILILVRGSRVALSRGMAAKVMIKRAGM